VIAPYASSRSAGTKRSGAGGNWARPYFVAAFANGFAEVDVRFPAPDWVQEVCEASVLMAEDLEGEPWILEAVRRQGKKAALWAKLHQRRDDLEATNRAHLKAVLISLLPHLRQPVLAAVQPHEAAQPDDLVSALQKAIEALGDIEGFKAWRQLTRDAMADGAAEGNAEATAWLALGKGQAIPDFDITFQAAIQAMRDLPPAWSDVDTWMGKQTHGLATQLGQQLSDAMASGASRDAMAQIVSDTVLNPQGYAGLMLDHAIATSAIQGALSLYQSEGVELVDAEVSPGACDDCEPLPDDNPYQLADAPDIPLHPRCRCAVAPHVD
jgi:hypothetical protein